MKMKNKRLWTTICVLALLGSGAVGTAVTLQNQSNKAGSSDTTPDSLKKESKITDDQSKEKNNKHSQDSFSLKKKQIKSNDEVVKEMYKRYGVSVDSDPLESESTVSSDLTPEEIRNVASVIQQQTKERQKNEQQKAPVLQPMVNVPPVEANDEGINQSVVPTLPKGKAENGSVLEPPEHNEPTPPVPVPNTASTPVIEGNENIVVLKGALFNPWDNFHVTDSLDPNVAVSISPTTIDTNAVGSQSFVVTATNKFGHSAVRKFNVTIVSTPSIRLASEEIEIPIGSTFNPMDYVSASDELEGDITTNVTVDSSEVDMNKEGRYNVVYSVQNTHGLSATAELSVVVKNEAPTIYAENTTIPLGQPFQPLSGVTAVAYNGEVIDLTNENIIENTVDVTKEGTYHVTYKVKDRFGKESEVTTRLVTVENSAPVLQGVKDLTFPLGTPITEELVLQGVSAKDVEDNQAGLTLQVTVDSTQLAAINAGGVGQYPLTYRVKDRLGKETEQQVTVTIIGEKPTISGVDNVKVPLNSNFDPLAGIIAFDQEDGVLPSSQIEVLGSVDTSIPGEYSLVYRVKDSQGQASIDYSRMVTVMPGEEKSEAFRTNVNQEITEPSEIVEIPQTPEAIQNNDVQLPTDVKPNQFSDQEDSGVIDRKEDSQSPTVEVSDRGQQLVVTNEETSATTLSDEATMKNENE